MADDVNPIRSSWASPMYAAQRPVPSWERLNAPSSRVMVVNTHEAQNFIVIDKYYEGHELRPGQRKEMELLNEEIAVFQSHRLPNRIGSDGLPKAPHAILIEGVPLMIDEQNALRDAKFAEEARKKELHELREIKELRELRQLESELASNRNAKSK